MANQWLRLWHDMPTDPKWRTIARASGQSIGNVMSVYVHLLVCASNATERGRTQSFNSEDIASALDIETEQVEQIITAMQGRVLDGDLVKGWETRQVAREDGSAERSKAWREAKKEAKKQDSDASERKRTQAERKQAPDKDTDKDTDKEGFTNTGGQVTMDKSGFDEFWAAWPKSERKQDKADCKKKWEARGLGAVKAAILADIEIKKQTAKWTEAGGKYIEGPLVYINGSRWEDGVTPSGSAIQPLNKQEALEAANFAAAERFAAMGDTHEAQ